MEKQSLSLVRFVLLSFFRELTDYQGAGSGIGKAVVELLLKKGAFVFALDINEEALSKVYKYFFVLCLAKFLAEVSRM